MNRGFLTANRQARGDDTQFPSIQTLNEDNCVSVDNFGLDCMLNMCRHIKIFQTILIQN